MKELSIDQFIDIVFNKICLYTGVKYNSINEREESATELIQMVLKNYPEKYVNEIVGAYFLADKKRFYDENNKVVELFRIVDYRQLSSLLQLFDLYFKNTFESEIKSQKFWYEPEPNNSPTEEEIETSFKNSLKIALEITEEGKTYNIAGSDLFLYHELKSRGNFDYLTESDREQYFNLAKSKRKADLLSEKFDKSTSIGRRAEISKMLENFMDEDAVLLNIGRRMILNDFLKEVSNNSRQIIF